MAAKHLTAAEIAQELRQLDPNKDCQRIVYLSSAYGDPWLARKSLEFALFRTYGDPKISRITAATSQFKRHGQKRYDDTTLIIATIVENGYDSELGRQAIERMNYWHGKYRIKNEHFLYVLSTFTFEPIRWFDRFGQRAMNDFEKQAYYNFWVEVGRRMNVEDIPSSYETFEQFNLDYERENFVYADSNHSVAEATVQIIIDWYPKWARGLGRQVLYALMDKPLRQAMGFPDPNWIVGGLTPTILKLRGQSRRLLPPRRTPYHFTQVPNRTYKQGFEVNKLGPDDPIEQIDR